MAEKLPWMRLYVEVLTDPKVQNLPDFLFKIWINLLLIARINDQKGKLPESIKDLSFMLHLSEKKTRYCIERLTAVELIDDGIMHNWEERQFESDKDPTNNERQRRYRSKKNNGSNALCNGQVTRYVTEEKRLPDTDTDTENINIYNKASEFSPDFLTFYDAYPRKEGKKAASKTYNARVKRGAAHGDIMASLAVYKAQIERNHTEQKFIKLPSTFLNCYEEYKPEQQKPRQVRFGFKANLVCPVCKEPLPFHGDHCLKCQASKFAGLESDEYYEAIV